MTVIIVKNINDPAYTINFWPYIINVMLRQPLTNSITPKANFRPQTAVHTLRLC